MLTAAFNRCQEGSVDSVQTKGKPTSDLSATTKSRFRRVESDELH